MQSELEALLLLIFQFIRDNLQPPNKTCVTASKLCVTLLYRTNKAVYLRARYRYL
jgi:hypothetical protein